MTVASKQRPVGADNPILQLVMSNLWRREWRKLWRNHCFNQMETSRDPQAHSMESLQIFCRTAAEQMATEPWFLQAVFLGSVNPDEEKNAPHPGLAPPVVQRPKEDDPETAKFRRVLQHYALVVRAGDRALEEAKAANPIADELVQINDELNAAMWGNPGDFFGGQMPQGPDLAKINQQLRDIWTKANGAPTLQVLQPPMKTPLMPLPSLQHIVPPNGGLSHMSPLPTAMRPGMNQQNQPQMSASKAPAKAPGMMTSGNVNLPLRPGGANNNGRPFNASLGVPPNPLAPNPLAPNPLGSGGRGAPLTPFKRPYQDGPGLSNSTSRAQGVRPPGAPGMGMKGGPSAGGIGTQAVRPQFGGSTLKIEGRHGALSRPIRAPLNPLQDMTLSSSDKNNNGNGNNNFNANNNMGPPPYTDGGGPPPLDNNGDFLPDDNNMGPPPQNQNTDNFDNSNGMMPPLPPMGGHGMMPPLDKGMMPPMDMGDGGMIPPLDGGMMPPSKEETGTGINKLLVTVPKSRPMQPN